MEHSTSEGKQDPPIIIVPSGQRLNNPLKECERPPSGEKTLYWKFDYNIPEPKVYFPTNKDKERNYTSKYLLNFVSQDNELEDNLSPGNYGPANKLKGCSNSIQKYYGEEIRFNWTDVHSSDPLEYLNTDRDIYLQEKNNETYLHKTLINKVEICQADLERLDSNGIFEGKLSGEIINAFLIEIISGKNIAMPSTYFGNKIKDPRFNYDNIMRKKVVEHWLNKTNKAIIPLHQQEHWTLCVVERKNNTIYHYNSLINCTSNQEEMLEDIAKYLEHIGYIKDAQIVQLTNIPQQNNNFDCGVFTCVYGYYAAIEKEIDFGQEHMEYFRMRIIKELMKSDKPRIYNKTTVTWAYAEGGKEAYITYDNIPKEEIQDCMFDEEETYIPEPNEYLNNPHQNIESICKFLENMPTEAKKQRLINNYRQKYKEELLHLQGQTEIPYVDYNEQGNFETINMKKDLSRSLILNEVLHILKLQHNITIQKSWEILEENLRRNPTILRKWLAIKTPIGIKTSPTNFQVGSNRNMKKLLSIAKKIKNKDKISILPHTRQRKNKRKSLYKRIRENRQKRNNKQTEMHLQV